MPIEKFDDIDSEAAPAKIMPSNISVTMELVKVIRELTEEINKMSKKISIMEAKINPPATWTTTTTQSNPMVWGGNPLYTNGINEPYPTNPSTYTTGNTSIRPFLRSNDSSSFIQAMASSIETASSEYLAAINTPDSNQEDEDREFEEEIINRLDILDSILYGGLDDDELDALAEAMNPNS